MSDSQQKIYSKKSFEDFGPEYQQQLIYEFLTDKRFGQDIVTSLRSEFFKDPAYAFIIKNAINYHSKHDVIPNFSVLAPELRINMNHDQTFSSTVMDTLEIIRKTEYVNPDIKSTAIKFCNLMALRDYIDDVKVKIDRGEISEYENISEGFKKILIDDTHDDSIDVFDNIENALNEEDRNVCPTGIDAIDNNTDGGLGRGEVGLIIAPTGVGKSTMLSKIANSSQMAGKNVLQIFFEDKYSDIQRKHITCYSGVPLDELKNNKKLALERTTEVKKLTTGKLILHKFPAEGVTMPKIKALVKKIKAMGIDLDMVLVDYLECIIPSSGGRDGEEWVGEGRIMRQFETLCEDEDVAGWIATQGTKLSTNIDVVKIEHMGGSIKKAQIGHFIIGAAKPLELRENDQANISILKNRLGPDGMVYYECEFNNKAMRITTGESNTLLGFAAIKQDKVEQLAYDAIRKSREKGDDDYDKFFDGKSTFESNISPPSGSTGNTESIVDTVVTEDKPPTEVKDTQVDNKVIEQPVDTTPPVVSDFIEKKSENLKTPKRVRPSGVPEHIWNMIYSDSG